MFDDEARKLYEKAGYGLADVEEQRDRDEELAALANQMRDYLPPDNDYIVTMTVQLALPAPTAGMARCEAIDHVLEMVSKTPFRNDPQNCWTVDSVVKISEDEL